MSLDALVRDDELHTRPAAERASERVLGPFHRFARWQASGALLLLVCAVGLEIKREFLVGELADARKAMLPIAAAIGGMLVPALCYAAFNAGGEGAHGRCQLLSEFRSCSRRDGRRGLPE